MKWKRPQVGDVRSGPRFAWLPTEVGTKTVWLERYWREQTFSPTCLDQYGDRHYDWETTKMQELERGGEPWWLWPPFPMWKTALAFVLMGASALLAPRPKPEPAALSMPTGSVMNCVGGACAMRSDVVPADLGSPEYEWEAPKTYLKCGPTHLVLTCMPGGYFATSSSTNR